MAEVPVLHNYILNIEILVNFLIPLIYYFLVKFEFLGDQARKNVLQRSRKDVQ
jgi:hypothetical protein